MRYVLLCSLLGLLAALPLAAQPVTTSTGEAREDVSLTVYNQNFAVVREVRPLALRRGSNLVRFEDVPSQIDATSLALKALSDPDAVLVQEQNYQYDLVNQTTILDKSVGDRIRLVQTREDGSETTLEGVLLSQPSQGLVLQLDDGRVLLNPPGRIIVDALPEGLVSRPSLLWRLDAARSATYPTEVSYLTDGITWTADYVAVVNEAEDAVDLTGWVTLVNGSGATYRDAELQLMAGDVRRVQENVQVRGVQALSALNDGLRAPEPAFGQEAFFEYHLYTLDGRTTVAQNETKQMTLLAAAHVGVERRLVFDPQRARRYSRGRGQGGGTQDAKLSIMLEWENTEANRMGMPLPKGKVRLYKADARGNLQFLGEDLIDHTPRNEDVSLYVGDAFDVVGTQIVKANRRPSDRISEQDIEVSIRNRKETSTEVVVVARGYGTWSVLGASHEFTTVDAYTAEFPLTLAPDEEVTVTYTSRSSW
ncbi:MAG: hypothetical protein AAGI91_05765 [Bacteroidota bacterium]